MLIPFPFAEKGFEFLFEADWRRQQGRNFLDQDYFLRYVAKNWIAKAEYLQDGFADVRYFEGSERLRLNVNNKFSFNIGLVQRISEPYGYDPLEEWKLSNGNLHYTYLALQEGYNIDPFTGTYTDPSGNIVATSNEVWKEVVIPQMLDNFVESERNKLDRTLQHSVIIGFDFYHYERDFWLHSWGNLMPYHYDNGDEYSYHNFNGGQWLDYSGGLIFGYWFNKNLGAFIEGKYNKYWNREWHNFSFGINYKIF